MRRVLATALAAVLTERAAATATRSWSGADSFGRGQNLCLATHTDQTQVEDYAVYYAVTTDGTCDASTLNTQPYVKWDTTDLFPSADSFEPYGNNLDAAAGNDVAPALKPFSFEPYGKYVSGIQTATGRASVQNGKAFSTTARHVLPVTATNGYTCGGLTNTGGAQSGATGSYLLCGTQAGRAAATAATATATGTVAMTATLVQSGNTFADNHMGFVRQANPNVAQDVYPPQRSGATWTGSVQSCGETISSPGTADASCGAASHTLSAGQLKTSFFAWIGATNQANYQAVGVPTTASVLVLRTEMNLGNMPGAEVTFDVRQSLTDAATGVTTLTATKAGLTLAQVTGATYKTWDVSRMTAVFNNQAIVTDFASSYTVGSAAPSDGYALSKLDEKASFTRSDMNVRVAAAASPESTNTNAFKVDLVFKTTPQAGHTVTLGSNVHNDGLDGAAGDVPRHRQRYVAYDPTVTYYPVWPAPASAAATEEDGRALCLIARYVTMACLNLLAAFAVVGVVFIWCYFSPCEWWCHPDLEEGVWNWNVKEMKGEPVPEPAKKQPKIKHIVYESESEDEVIETKRIEHHEIGDDEEIVVRKKSGEVVSGSRSVDPELFASINDTVKSVDPGLNYTASESAP
jgi:hypothetical protein